MMKFVIFKYFPLKKLKNEGKIQISFELVPPKM